MPSLAFRTEKRKSTKHSHECVLLIHAEADDAARILEELGSATDERFDGEWVRDLSSGLERLSHGGVGAIVLDMTSAGSHAIETFDKLFQAASGVPILILTEADAEEMARKAVQRGAQDYLLKNQADGYRMRQALRTMMERRSTQAIVLENQVSNVTLDSIGEAVLRTDAHGNVAYLNRIAEDLTGWSQKKALGRHVADVLRIIDAVSGVAVRDALEIVMQEDKTAGVTANCINCILVRPDGFKLGIEITVTPLHDQDGAATGAVVAFRDVSVARATSLEMSHLAQHDFLTDLPNRMLFNDRLKQAISLAVRQGKQLAVMFVDLDHFKRINDSLGHGVGDKLLQSVAARLVTCVRRTDTVSRMGGDEFVVLLSQVENGEDAAVSARKILRVLALPHIIDNKSLDVNVSIGVSTYPSDGPDAESLMNKADTAMYEAKQHGRNTYQFFRRDMHARLADRQLLERDLRYALGRNEFLLHYQPKFNLQTGQITGVEALIRWEHPLRGLVYPGDFVPIAEECGLILAIGRWVLLEACRQARVWNDEGLGVVPVAVNVSASEFGDKDFVSGVRAALIATGVAPPNLELELTETVLMEDAESTVRTLGALKAMGVRLAIDDFGTGYSSFTYLRRFPVDALKLHQSFVQEISADPEDATIVDAMINIGKSLKQRVIAEGVETRAQLKFLQRHGCAEAQGYYFSRPVGAGQVGELLKSGLQPGVFN
jgi:diguanylate cyclase (GGDEF)-like protein/PAS domain S-box-containing protein